MTMETKTVRPTTWHWPFTYYGVELSPLGEDGEHLITAGHPDPRRVIAAFNRYARVVCGLRNLNDDPRADAGDVADIARELKQDWAVLGMECEFYQDHGPYEDCSTCQQIRSDDGWLFWGRDADEDGAFPVTVLRWW
jgi:hypothetical protein